MDESDVSCYICGVIRFRFIAALLAFLISGTGSLPSLANETLWTGSSAGQARADALLKAIRAAEEHGLDPKWYGLAEVEKAVLPGADPAAVETLLTAAFVAYASDLSTGRVRANRIDKDIDIVQRKVERADLLKAAAEAQDFAAWLADLAPKGDYPALQKALAVWRDKRKVATFTQLPDGNLLRPGMTDPRVPLVRTRLAELDLAVPEPAESALPELYDEPLVAVVKSYQETKGLTVDGIIAPRPRSRSTPRSTSASGRSSPTSSAAAGCPRTSAVAT
jgi:L,D-transpeptidase YcbB